MCLSETQSLFLFGVQQVMYCFKQLEKFANEKYPKFLKKILLDCGYDCPASLNTINEEAINKIEIEINSNLDKYIQYFKSTAYEKKLENNGELKFLIGHRAILLDIPRKLKEFSEEKTREKERTKLNKKNSNTTKNLAQNLSEKELIEKLSDKIINYYKNKGVLVASCHYFSSETLLEKLKNNELTLTKNQVKNEVKCKLKCPFCDTKKICNLYKYWNVSNFTKHCNTHDEKLRHIDRILSANIVPSNNNSKGLANSNSVVTARGQLVIQRTTARTTVSPALSKTASQG